MTDPVLISPETGLPVVPADYFWRLRSNTFGLTWTLELRKKTRWGSRRRRDCTVLPSDETAQFRTTDDWEHYIRVEAAELWQYEFDDLSGSRYLGDYPPKRLSSDVREKDDKSYPLDEPEDLVE